MIELDREMRAHLNGVVDDLVNSTGGAYTRQDLSDRVDAAFNSLAENATIAQFLPVLAGRLVQTQLRAENIDAGTLMKDKPEVLVLCEQNRGRSQAAAALFRFYAPGELNVESAGCHPGRTPNSRILAFLRERGVLLTDYPKPFTPQMVRVADHLVVIGDLSCELPAVSGQDRTFWSIEDPEEADTEEIDRIVREVDADVRTALHRWFPDMGLHRSIVAPY